MSRFPDASVVCLKRVMLVRAPDFYFKDGDEAVIKQETVFNSAQIWKWGEHFRIRYESTKERMDFLTADSSEKVT